MSDSIYHHTRCNLDDGSGDLHGKASVALFDGGVKKLPTPISLVGSAA